MKDQEQRFQEDAEYILEAILRRRRWSSSDRDRLAKYIETVMIREKATAKKRSY